jgi:hypothetical protein
MAEQLPAETGIDCWLVFCRETSESPEPALPLVLDADHHAVVGRCEPPPVSGGGGQQLSASGCARKA